MAVVAEAWRQQLGGGSLGAAAAAAATTAALPLRAVTVAMKTPAATVMAGAWTNNNQLKVVAAMAAEMAMMTATMTTM